MQKINIDDIIKTLDYSKTGIKYEGMKQEFLNVSSSGIVDFHDIPVKKREKVDKAKYNKYGYVKFDSLKKVFFEKVYKAGIRNCCYCGKNPIIHYENGIEIKTGNTKQKRLYDIEHFLPRSKYPDLSVNLYNWLPVCISCNQRLKSDFDPLDKAREGGKIFHPYFGWLEKKDDSIVVSEENKNFDKEFSFAGNAGMKSLQSEHSQFFKLPQIYLNSQDTFNTFAFIQDKRNKMKAEKNHYAKSSGKSNLELKNYFFKNYYPETENDILKFANGKLKKDLISKI